MEASVNKPVVIDSDEECSTGYIIIIPLIVEQIGSSFWWNHSLYDKSMKLGTQLEHVIKIILRYRAIADLTSDLYGSIFFRISDKIINFQSLILLIWHFFNCT